MAQKIVMKVMVTSLSCIKDNIFNGYLEESIIPFQDDGIITFTIFFTVLRTDTRGGQKIHSLSAIFHQDERSIIYKDAAIISDTLKKLSHIIRLQISNENDYSQEFLNYLGEITTQIIGIENWSNFKLINKIKITCPICSNSKLILITKPDHKKTLIEHEIFKDDICAHKFTVYLDSDFNILGYKPPKFDKRELKEKISKLKSPYNSLLR